MKIAGAQSKATCPTHDSAGTDISASALAARGDGARGNEHCTAVVDERSVR